jgi:hypothetical protein
MPQACCGLIVSHEVKVSVYILGSQAHLLGSAVSRWQYSKTQQDPRYNS